MLFLLTAGFTVSAQDSIVRMSVRQAVDYAKQHNVQVRNALLDIQIQKQTNREITSAALPQISGNGSFSYFPNIAVQSFPNFIAAGTYGVLEKEGVVNGGGQNIVTPADLGFIQAQFGTKYIASGGFELSQLLFDGQVFAGLMARKTAMNFSAKQAEVTEEMINVNLQKIYYQLVVGRQQITSIDANIDRFSKLLSDTRAIYKEGFAEKLDVDKTTVQLNNLQTEKIKAKSQLDAGFAALKFLMNFPQKDSIVLTDSITPEQIKENILTDNINYDNRKEYQLLQLAKRLGELNVKRYKLTYIPTLSLFANYMKNAQRNEFDFFKRGPWFTSSVIGLNLNVPIFDGFGRDARIKRARLELAKTNNNIEQFKASADQDVKVARLTIAAALTTLDNQQRNVRLAEDVYQTTKKKYEAGLGSNQEIYNAQAELKVAQNNYYAALYDAVIARIDFLKAIGQIQ